MCSFLALTNSLNSVNFYLYDKKHRPKKKHKNIYFRCKSKNVSFVVPVIEGNGDLEAQFLLEK